MSQGCDYLWISLSPVKLCLLTVEETFVVSGVDFIHCGNDRNKVTICLLVSGSQIKAQNVLNQLLKKRECI